ncbi:MAG: aminoacyl-tRNA hydrolase [Calditrichota bacterium]
MYLIVGLGNPGPKYTHTRHNAGFMVLDRYAAKISVSFRQGRGPYDYAFLTSASNQIMLIKPNTYVNFSGNALKYIFENMIDIDLAKILIVLDDLDLPFGTIRFRQRGGSAGHKGLENIINAINTKNIARLRIGIGNGYDDPIQYVLSDFSAEEFEKIDIVLDAACEGINTFINDGIKAAMNLHNRNLMDN